MNKMTELALSTIRRCLNGHDKRITAVEASVERMDAADNSHRAGLDALVERYRKHLETSLRNTRRILNSNRDLRIENHELQRQVDVHGRYLIATSTYKGTP